MPPPVRYVRNRDVSIAYQLVGEGPHDLLMIPGWSSHLALDELKGIEGPRCLFVALDG